MIVTIDTNAVLEGPFTSAEDYVRWVMTMAAKSYQSQFGTPTTDAGIDASWQAHNESLGEPPSLEVQKSRRIAAINAEAGRRIESVWPLWAQSNASLGVYPESDANACRQWIEQHIDASNTATARVNAATTAAEIDAVVVAWPEATP